MAPISYSRVKLPIFFPGHGSLKSIFFLVEREEGERDEGELILSCLVPLSAAKVEVEEKSRLFPLSSVFAFPSSSAEEEEDEEGLFLVGVFMLPFSPKISFLFSNALELYSLVGREEVSSLFPFVPTGCLFLFGLRGDLVFDCGFFDFFEGGSEVIWFGFLPIFDRLFPFSSVFAFSSSSAEEEENEERLFLVGVFMLPLSPKISFLFSIALELFFLVGREEVSSLFPLVPTGCLFLFWIQKNLSCSKSSWVVFAKVENESFGSKTPSRLFEEVEAAPSTEVATWEEKPSVFEKVESELCCPRLPWLE